MHMHSVRRKLAVLTLTSAFALSGLTGSAFGAIQVGPGNGNPDTNASGKCPGGQNKETSPGGLKKCP